jgi:chromosome segregation ATPase
MKSIEECENVISDLTKKLQLVENAIAEKEKEIESLKRSNAKLIELTIGRKRMPKSLTVQRRSISDISDQIEELKFAEKAWQRRLSKAKEELSFAHLYERVKVFKDSEETFFNRINEIAACMSNIDEAVQIYKNKVEQLKTNGHPLIKFQEILRELQGKVSYEDFFSKGEMAKPDSKDNAFIDAMIHRYRNIRKDLPGLDDLNLIGLIFWNQLSHISAKAGELRSFKYQPQ